MHKLIGGDEVNDNHSLAIVGLILKRNYPELAKKDVKYRVFENDDQSKNEPDKCLTVMPFGAQTPLSKCCKMTICFKIIKDVGGKVACME